MEETFAGRKFHGFAFFWTIRECLFHEIFQTEASAKVYSREIPRKSGHLRRSLSKRLKERNLLIYSTAKVYSLENSNKPSSAKVYSREMEIFRGSAARFG